MGALVIPDGKYSAFKKSYAKLRRTLKQEKGEVKGRLLDERAIRQVADVLYDSEALFEACAIDLDFMTPDDIEEHRTGQAAGMVKNLTAEHQPGLVEQVAAMKNQLDVMAAPQYVQAVLMVSLIARTLQHARLYYSMRRPAELGKYLWTIDGKSDAIGANRWESWWSDFVCPILEASSADRPLAMIKGGRYEAEAKFTSEVPEWKRSALGFSSDELGLDLRRIVRDRIRFSPQPLYGLEAVDIMTNATRRSLVGNLQRPGWLGVRKLMIHTRQHYISFATLGAEPNFPTARPYRHVLKDFTTGGRIMIPDHHPDQ